MQLGYSLQFLVCKSAFLAVVGLLAPLQLTGVGG